MGLHGIQERVDAWVSQYNVSYWRPHEILAKVIEEVGELAKEINHLWGPEIKKPGESASDISEEVGDIIFALCCLANSRGIDLDASFDEVMRKCYTRDKDRYEKKKQ